MYRRIKLEHLISFSDAIFAFSITFMAVTIQIPDLPENLNQSQVINRLGELVTYFAIYALVLTLTGLILFLIWLHAKKNQLIDENLNPIEIQGISLQSGILPAI